MRTIVPRGTFADLVYPIRMSANAPDVRYSEEVAAQICRRLAHGETLLQICESDDMPDRSAIHDWTMSDSRMLGAETFGEAYRRAREVQVDYFADEVVTLSDRCRIGEKVEIKTEGKAGVPEITTKVMTADMVERTKLQIDARKWFASKVSPHKYGDRLAHQMLDENGKPARAGITVIVDGAPGSKP